MMTTQPSSSRGTQSSSKGTLAKRRRNTEGDDYSDSDEDDDLPLTAKRMLVRAAPALEANKNNHWNAGSVREKVYGRVGGANHDERKTPDGDDDPTEGLRNGDGVHDCARNGDWEEPARRRHRTCGSGETGYSTGGNQETSAETTACFIL